MLYAMHRQSKFSICAMAKWIQQDKRVNRNSETRAFCVPVKSGPILEWHCCTNYLLLIYVWFIWTWINSICLFWSKMLKDRFYRFHVASFHQETLLPNHILLSRDLLCSPDTLPGGQQRGFIFSHQSWTNTSLEHRAFKGQIIEEKKQIIPG